MMSWNLGGCMKTRVNLRNQPPSSASTPSTPNTATSPPCIVREPEVSLLQRCLTCYLCGDIFRRPRMLPCGHTFCSECLAKLKDEVMGESHLSKPRAVSRSAYDVSNVELQREEEQSNAYLGFPDSLRGWDPSPDRSSDVDGFNEATDLSHSWSAQTHANGYYGNSFGIRANGNTCGSRLSRSQTFTTEPSQFLSETEPRLRGSRRNASRANENNVCRLSAPPDFTSSQASNQTCSKCGSVTKSDSPATLPRRTTRKQVSKATSLSPRPVSSPVNIQSNWNRSKSCSTVISPSKQTQHPRKSAPTTPILPRWSNSPQRSNSSSHGSSSSFGEAQPGSFEHRHGREMEQLFCPIPGCGYSIRLMNLARWSPRNRIVAEVIAAWREQHGNTRCASTQTEIRTDQSLLVTIPRSLVDSRALQPLGMPQGRRRHSSMVDMAIDTAITMDSLDRGYLPRGHVTWRTYAAMVGMNILQQLVNL